MRFVFEYNLKGDNYDCFTPRSYKISCHKVAKIRAEYKGFKTMYAFQLEIAMENNTDLFFTNDKQLKQLKDLKCLVVDDFLVKEA